MQRSWVEQAKFYSVNRSELALFAFLARTPVHRGLAEFRKVVSPFPCTRTRLKDWKADAKGRGRCGYTVMQLRDSTKRRDVERRIASSLAIAKTRSKRCFRVLFYQEIGWKRATRIRLFAGNVVKVFDRREFQVGTSLLVRTYLHTLVYHLWRIANSSDTAAFGYWILRYICPQITRSNVEF